MATLQIRDLPQAIYRALSAKARRERRSLAQQAVIELGRVTEESQRQRRTDALRDLRTRLAERGEVGVARPPAEIVREDRDR